MVPSFKWYLYGFTIAAAITQAICDGRGQFGATGPILCGPRYMLYLRLH